MPGVQDGSSGGSPWPKFGDLLQRSLGVPVAIASVGHGNSSIFDWQPGAEPGGRGIGKALYPALRDRLESLGPVRAVLWHQGETDAREAVGEDEYVDAFIRLRTGLRDDTGLDPPWVVANATFLTENTADAMEPIRRAQQRLWAEGLALRGPDTDQLQGALRKWDRVHFSRSGLGVHAELWYSLVWAQLFAADPAPARRVRGTSGASGRS
jgi:hypothetical protein